VAQHTPRALRWFGTIYWARKPGRPEALAWLILRMAEEITTGAFFFLPLLLAGRAQCEVCAFLQNKGEVGGAWVENAIRMRLWWPKGPETQCVCDCGCPVRLSWPKGLERKK